MIAVNSMIAKKYLGAALCLILQSAALAQSRQWTLNECIDYAVSHNIDIQKRAVEIKQREIALNTAQNAWMPTVNADVSGVLGFGNPSGAGSSNMSVPSSSGMALQGKVSASMPLFDGFKIPNQKHASRYSLDAATANLEAAKKDLSINVSTFYLNCLYYKGLADVARSQVEMSRQLVERSKTMVEDGKRPYSEQADAEAQLALDEHSLIDAEGQYTLSLLSLSQLLNLPELEGFQIVDDETALGISPQSASLTPPQNLFDDIVDNWPSILAGQSSLKEKEYLLKVQRAGYYPTLNLQGSIGASAYQIFDTPVPSFGKQIDNSLGEIIGLNLSIPIFNQFKTRNNIRQAKNDILLSQLSLDDNRLKLRKEIQTAYYNATVAARKRESSTKSCEANRISVDYEQIRFDEGRSDIFTLLQARQKFVKAQQDAVQAKYESLIRLKILDFYTQR